MDKYRFDHAYDSVYEYDEGQRAYLFIGKLLGRTEEEFLRDLEILRADSMNDFPEQI